MDCRKDIPWREMVSQSHRRGRSPSLLDHGLIGPPAIPVGMASSKPRLTGKLDLMAALDRGLYEVLITEALRCPIKPARRPPPGHPRRPAGGRSRRSHRASLARSLGQAIAAIDERERTAVGIDLARRLIDMIREMPDASGLAAERPVEAGELLRSIIGRLPDGRRNPSRRR